MKNFNKILLITLLFVLKFNSFSQVCNQSTLNPSADPNFTVITVNTTKNPGWNIYLCPGITVYDTLGNAIVGSSIIYVSPNSKFIYKSTFWGNTKIFAKSTSTVVIKNFTGANFCVPSWTIVSEPGATIINQTTVAITGTNNISCASLQGPNVVCPSCLVSINTIPSSTVCSGNSATLSASGATTYTWLPGNIQSPTLSIMPVSNTVYTVNGSCGSFSSSATKTITVNQTPTVNVSLSSSTLCSGQSATAIASGATSYTWAPGSLTGATQVLSPSATQVYTITGSNGSCSTSKSATIIVNQTPTVNVSLSSSTLCSGQSATAIASGATSYTWVPGNLTGATQVLSPSATQVYTISGSNGNCSSSSIKSLTVLICTGIDENSNNALLVNVFPNPFTDELTIEVNEPSQITLSNALGQVVKTVNVSGKTILNTKELPKALYNLSIKTQSGSRNIKLIKE
ncbi:MAG: T9SS type A sorting domain-containing protein [Sphingobacteriaceae bacterium]